MSTAIQFKQLEMAQELRTLCTVGRLVVVEGFILDTSVSTGVERFYYIDGPMELARFICRSREM